MSEVRESRKGLGEYRVLVDTLGEGRLVLLAPHGRWGGDLVWISCQLVNPKVENRWQLKNRWQL